MYISSQVNTVPCGLAMLACKRRLPGNSGDPEYAVHAQEISCEIVNKPVVAYLGVSPSGLDGACFWVDTYRIILLGCNSVHRNLIEQSDTDF